MESGQNLDSFPSFCPKRRKNLDMRLLFLFLFYSTHGTHHSLSRFKVLASSLFHCPLVLSLRSTQKSGHCVSSVLS